MPTPTQSNPQSGLVKYGIAAAVLFVAFLILWPFKVVNSTERGLKFRLGALQDKILEPGIHFKTPFIESIKTVSIQPIEFSHSVAVGHDGAITKDNQTIGAELTVYYKNNPDRLVELWSKYGEDKIRSIVGATIRESFKEAIGSYDIFSLPVKQDEIRSKVFESVRARLAAYPIELTELKVVNYDWSEEFDKQIQATMASAQKVRQAEQELLITEQQAQKKVKEAEADKEAAIKRAEADRDTAKLSAEAKALQGEGIRQYNESVAKNLDMELKLRQLEIEKTKWEKWNGAFVATNNYGPIPVSVGGLVK